MKTLHAFSRALLPVALVGLLAGCQTMQGGTPGAGAGSETAAAPAPTQPTPAPQESAAGEPARQGAPVAVLLADTIEQEGWTAVPVQAGTLYVNPQPVLTRDDLTGVQAGRGRSGEGLLALGITPEAQIRLQDATTQFPNKRLALVVGRTMLAAPSYTTPVSTDQLVFPVGSEQNAAAAARAIAGQDAPDEAQPPAQQ